MKKRILIMFFALQMIVSAQNQDSNPALIMEDGQIKTHPVRVFIRDVYIKKEMKPVLCLVAINDDIRGKAGDLSCMGPLFEPFEVATDQTRTYDIAGTPVTIKGTMMLFDIHRLKISTFHTGLRVVPIIRWVDKREELEGQEFRAHYANIIGEKEIFVGNPIPAVGWTVLVVAVFVGMIWRVSSKLNKNFWDLIKIYDSDYGRLSLSLTQMLIWTLVVGSMVMIFSFMYLKVPEIPDSLVALMGLSITTASIGHYQAGEFRSLSKDKKKENENEAKKGFWNGIYDLLSAEKQGKTYLSIAKAQHLFWTLLIVILFIFKSKAEGQLWSVPNELVTLMGVSQGSYLIRNQLEIRQFETGKPNQNREIGKKNKKKI